MKICISIILSAVLFFLCGQTLQAQIAPAGDVVIQNPTGVYYLFHSDGTYPNGAKFIYVNYSTSESDRIDPTVFSNGSFSGVSPATGRTLTGQIQAGSISLTYNGVSQSGATQSSFGPARRYAGDWMGFIKDPSSGLGFGEALITSQGQCFVASAQGSFVDIGVGTIDASGNVSVPLTSGRLLTGTFAPSNGSAQGSFNLSTGVTDTYSVVRAIPPRLFNISTRGFVGIGEQVLIGGFIVTDGGKSVVIRAIGPSLGQSGVTNPVQSTKVSVFSGQQVIASNQGWQNSSAASELVAGGYAPSDIRESALKVSLEPGAYTAIVSSADGSTGVGLVEVFGVGSTEGP